MEWRHESSAVDIYWIQLDTKTNCVLIIKRTSSNVFNASGSECQNRLSLFSLNGCGQTCQPLPLKQTNHHGTRVILIKAHLVFWAQLRWYCIAMTGRVDTYLHPDDVIPLDHGLPEGICNLLSPQLYLFSFGRVKYHGSLRDPARYWRRRWWYCLPCNRLFVKIWMLN